MSSFSTIACCIDLTENNEDIVSYCREMAELTGAKIILVHVLPPVGSFSNYGSGYDKLKKVAEDSRSETEKHVREFAAKYFSDLKSTCASLRPNTFPICPVPRWC